MPGVSIPLGVAWLDDQPVRGYGFGLSVRELSANAPSVLSARVMDMELRFECPKCGQSISAKPDQVGLRAKCRRCAVTFTVPNPMAGDPIPIVPLQAASASHSHPFGDFLRQASAIWLQPRYLVLAVSAMVWLYQSSAMSTYEQQAAPLTGELQRMSTGGYQVESGIEAFLRGTMGDPFGKMQEESNKDSSLRSQLASISSEYESAAGMRGFAGLVAFCALCWIGYKYWRINRSPTVSPT